MRASAVALALAAVLCLAGRAPAAAAEAKPPLIAVVDVQAILRDSKAAKTVHPQIEKFRDRFQKDVRQRENELRAASQDLARQRAVLSAEAFAKKRREYEAMARNAQVEVQAKKRQLDRAFSNAMGKVQSALIKATAHIATERKIDLVLPKTLILLSAKSLDITQEVMRRVDKDLPTVKVTLPKLESAKGDGGKR